MPPHHRHPHPNPPHSNGGPAHAHWFYSAEEALPVTEVGRLLVRFGESLIASRRIALRADVDVAPPDPCPTLVRFELTPKGHKLLKIELKWGEEFAPDGGDSLAVLAAAAELDTPSAEAANDGGEVI
jgi:hypothetical protein